MSASNRQDRPFQFKTGLQLDTGWHDGRRLDHQPARVAVQWEIQDALEVDAAETRRAPIDHAANPLIRRDFCRGVLHSGYDDPTRDERVLLVMR